MNHGVFPWGAFHFVTAYIGRNAVFVDDCTNTRRESNAENYHSLQDPSQQRCSIQQGVVCLVGRGREYRRKSLRAPHGTVLR